MAEGKQVRWLKGKTWSTSVDVDNVEANLADHNSSSCDDVTNYWKEHLDDQTNKHFSKGKKRPSQFDRKRLKKEKKKNENLPRARNLESVKEEEVENVKIPAKIPNKNTFTLNTNFENLDTLNNLLMEASSKGDLETLKNIFKDNDSGVFNINISDCYANSLLHVACAFGQPNCAKFLISKGIDHGLWNDEGLTPLMCAAAFGCVATVDLLLAAGANVNQTAQNLPECKTALHWAVQFENTECLLHLLKCGATPNSFSIENGEGNEAPIHVAAKVGNVPCLQLLIRFGADVNLQSGKTLSTALHLATEEDRVRCVETLLKANASTDIKNHREQTALHASAGVDFECTSLLLKYGANPNDRDKNLRTPLHTCAVRSEGDVTSECMELLYQYNAELNYQDRFGYTALHLAAINENFPCVSFLLKQGADITLRTKRGVNGLEMLVKNMPHVIRYVKDSLDSAITIRGQKASDPDCKLQFDFRAIITNSVETSDNIQNKLPDKVMRKETEFLACLVEHRQKSVLSHPLIEAFLILKWARVRKFFWLSLAFNLFVVLLFSSYVTIIYKHMCPYNKTLFDKLEKDPFLEQGCERTSVPESFRLSCGILWILLTVFTILLVGKEFAQFIQSPKAYFKRFANYGQWFIIVSILLTSAFIDPYTRCLCEYIYQWQYTCAAYAVLVAWILLLLRVGRLPILGLYIQMLLKVLKNFGLFISAYACILIAFALAFGILLVDEPNFGNILFCLETVIIMMTGQVSVDLLRHSQSINEPMEIEINDYTENSTEYNRTIAFMGSPSLALQFPISTHLIFMGFLVCVTIVLMNLLVGLAVNDIHGLLEGAKLARLYRQTQAISQLESFLFSKGFELFLPSSIRHFFQRNVLLVPLSYRWTYRFYPNDPRDKRLPKKLQEAALRIAETRQASKRASMISLVSKFERNRKVSLDNNITNNRKSIGMYRMNSEENLTTSDAYLMAKLESKIQSLQEEVKSNSAKLADILILLQNKSKEKC